MARFKNKKHEIDRANNQNSSPRHAQKSNREIFDDLVADALKQIPKQFRQALKNISIIVEDKPDRDLLKEIGYDPDELLLGLFVGVPLQEKSIDDDFSLPDRIYIFRKPLKSICKTPEELREQIRITLIHELAHYFGFDEDHLENLGLG